MNYGVSEVMERLENEQSSFSNLSVTSPTSQLILQSFRRFTCVKAHSPTLPLLHLRHSSFSNPSFASPTTQALHLRHLARRPCTVLYIDAVTYHASNAREASLPLIYQTIRRNLILILNLHLDFYGFFNVTYY